MIFKVILLCLICHIATGQPFTLTGTIKGKDSGRIFLHYKDVNNQLQSTSAAIQQGKFHVQGTVAGADRALLEIDSTEDAYNSTSRFLFIEPSMMNVTFQAGKIGEATISGSKTQSESNAWNRFKDQELSEVKRITAAVDSLRALLKNGAVDGKAAGDRIKELNIKAAPLWRKMNRNDVDYINQHPGSYLSVSLLTYLVGRLPDDSVDHLYEQLSVKVKTSSLGNRFSESYIRYKKAVGAEYPFDRLTPGSSAPPFSLYKQNGDSFGTTAYKGRVVLLEFWELTCLPCLEANPNLEKLRQSYKDGEVRIIAVTSTQKPEFAQLLSYIDKNKLSHWTHVSIDKTNDQSHDVILWGSFQLYRGLGVPRTVVIDRNGKVVYKNFGYSKKEFETLKAIVGKAVADYKPG